MKRLFFIVLHILLLLSFRINAQKIYWSEGNQVRSANLDGSTITTVFSDPTDIPDNIELDIENELIFYQSGLEDLFRASIFDGSNKQLTTNYGAFTGFTDFAIIPVNEYVFMNFWQEGSDGGVDRNGYYDGDNAYISLPLNNPSDITDEEFNAIATDENNEYVFFSIPTGGLSGIYRTTMDGLSYSQIETGIFGSVMEFDNRREKLYYTNSANNQILRMNADGSSIEAVLSTGGAISNIAINELDGSIYWLEGSEIKRAEYDGSNITTLISGLSSPTDIEIYIDPSSILVTNTNDSGPGSLRAAIEGSNLLFGIQNILFEIPGVGPHNIIPSSSLPIITDRTFINGYTQPGATENSGTTNIDSDIRVIINGQNVASDPGLNIAADNSTVSGLSIINFTGGAGIEINANNVSVNGNFIGVREDGATGAPNDLGIAINDVSGAVIGGTTPNLFNLISSNTTGGINITNSSGNTIHGNFIGTNSSGTEVLAGGSYGIMLNNSSGNTIGGPGANAGNILANQGDGLVIQGASSTGNDIFGNFIGTNSLDLDLKNNSTGIYIHTGANGNIIGGINAGEGNTIGYNPNHGILIEDTNSDFNSIRGNAIYCASADNISLGSGANDNHTPPGINYISKDSISGTAAANDIIDLYRDFSNCSPDGSTEYVATVNANGSGFWYYNTPGIFYPSEKVVAIATSASGNSSPFSAPEVVPIGYNSATLSANNQYIDLEFDFPAYGDAGASLPVGINDLTANFTRNGGSALTVDIIALKNTDGTDIGTATDLTGGEFTVRVFINVSDGYPLGVEKISFSAANDAAIFDESGTNLLSSAISPEVTLNPAPRITNSTINFDICSGASTNITIQSDLAGSTFQWTTSSSSTDLSGFTASGTINPIVEAIDNIASNIGTVTYTAIAINNEIEGPQVDFTVDVTPAPSVIPSIASDTICSATSSPISLSSSITPLTSFSWTVSGPANITGYNNSGGPLINQVLTNSGTSTGNVTYTVTPTSNGCPGTPTDIVIGVKPVGSVFFSSTDMNICSDENSVDLDIDISNSLGPWSVTLHDGSNDTQETFSFSPYTFADVPVNSNSTDFTIASGTDNQFGVSCPLNITGSDVTITQLEEISVTSPIADTTVCETVTNVSIPLEFTGEGPWNITYTYNNATNTTTIPPDNQSLSIPAIIGTNTLEIINVVDVAAPSCTGNANVSVVIRKVSAPTATLSLAGGGTSTSTCQNETVTLSLALTGDGPWEVVLLKGSTPQTLTINNPNEEVEVPVTGTQDFAYSIQSVTSTNINCVGTGFGIVNINVVALPSAPTINSLTGSNSVCEGATNIAYNVTSINNASSYQWEFTNGVSHAAPTTDDNSNSILADFPQSITASEITVSGVNGCGTGPPISIPVQVNLRASDPDDISGQENICQNTSNVTYSIPAVGNATGYVWDVNYANDISDQRLFTNNPNLNLNFTSSFEGAELTVAAYNNCDTSANRSTLTISSVNLPEKASAPEGPVITCADSEITLTVPEITGANEYEWFLPSVFTPVDGSNRTTTNSIIVNTGNETGIQNVNVAGINDCGTGLRADNSLRISVQTSPVIEIIVPESAYLGEEVAFTGVENSGQEVVDWQWDFGDGSSSFGTSVTHIYEEGGVFTVTLTAANSSDCQISSTGNIEIINELPVTIMNVITANNDGSNDGLHIDGVELFPRNEVAVFNRMGIEILNIEDYNNNWEAITNGTSLEEGNYIVIFRVKGTELTKKQTVSVLK